MMVRLQKQPGARVTKWAEGLLVFLVDFKFVRKWPLSLHQVE
jgi:hypothetical protein